MDIGRYIIWILLVIVVYLLLSCQRLVLRDHDGTVLRTLLIIGKCVAAIFIAYVIVAENTRIAWKGGLFFCCPLCCSARRCRSGSSDDPIWEEESEAERLEGGDDPECSLYSCSCSVWHGQYADGTRQPIYY